MRTAAGNSVGRCATPLLLALLTAASCTGNGSGDARPNIVLISMDTVRADRLGCYGFRGIHTPVIDSLAAAGVIFRNAIAPTPLTLPSHTTLLTGLYPTAHGVRDNTTYRLSERARTLPEILKENGYRTGAAVGAFVLDRSRGLDQGFDHYDDELPKPVQPSVSSLLEDNEFSLRTRMISERSGSEVTRRALSWLRENAGETFFLWIHYFDPHYPYSPPPPYSTRYRKTPYYGEIAFVDENIGLIVKELRAAGLADNTLVVLTGDHGESLGEHGEYTHCIFIYDATVRVPLIMSWPDGLPSGRSVGDVVSLADVLPTVLDLAGIETDSPHDGSSLSGLIRGDHAEERVVYSESMFSYLNYGWGPLSGLRGPRWKYIRAPEPELYNLSQDPAERRNLYDEKPDLARRFDAMLEEAIAGAGTTGAGLAEDAALSEQDRERLQSLGYVSGSPPAPEQASLRDPKDMITFHDLINLARQAMWNGEVGEAQRLLEQVIDGDPTNALARNMMGMVYRNRGELPQARAQFEKAIELNPGYAEAHRNLGLLAFRRGDYQAAADSYERALELEPSAGSDCLALAEIYRNMGDEQRAGEFEARAARLGYSPP